MAWEFHPAIDEEEVQAALLAAVERALTEEHESAWWRSGLEDLDGGSAPKQSWSDSGVIEP